MLKIRLARVGKKKRPTYRLIVSESSKDTYGRYLENLGHYNPVTKVVEVNKERILYWISQGAQPSATAHNLLVSQNVIEGKKVKAYKPKKKTEEKQENNKAIKQDKPADAPADKPAEEKVEEKVEEKKAEAKPKEKPQEEKKEEKKEESKEEKPEGKPAADESKADKKE